MPIVRRDTFDDVVAKFSATGLYAVDTETTGLRAYLGDRLFSIIIAGEAGSFYFNFQKYSGLAEAWVLGREHMAKLQLVFGNWASRFAMHNAKFDLAMLAREGLEVRGHVHCTEATARVLYNRHMTYSLDACAEREGLSKSKAAAEYIKKHRLYTDIEVEGGKVERQPHYDRLPFPLVSEYGIIDGEITYRLAKKQIEDLAALDHTTPSNFPSPLLVYENEVRLTKTCFKIETVGVKIDRLYCREALEFERSVAAAAVEAFEKQSGETFKDSAFPLAKAFDAVGETYPRTKPSKSRPLGTPSFTDDVLAGFASPMARHLRTYRGASKKANTYYANFLCYADDADRIHANMRQAGTDTGRFSVSSPNIQNLSREENQAEKFLVRRAFVPTDKDWCFVMIDYKAMEFRLMLDYVNEKGVIRQIIEEGLDVHEATAKQMGVSRQEAKTLNFLLLYGGGAARLADALGITENEGKSLKRTYFSKLPNISAWTKLVQERAGKLQLLRNWMGRRYHFPYIDSPTYKGHLEHAGPNHLVQGGCADVVKVSMNRIDDFLEKYLSRMLAQVHDELLFEIHRTELDIVPQLVKIMESAYPYKHLPLTCDVAHSWVSWADKVAGYPT